MDENKANAIKEILFSWYDYLEKWTDKNGLGYIGDDFRITEYGSVLALINICLSDSCDSLDWDIIHDDMKYLDDTPKNRDKLIQSLLTSFPSIEIEQLNIEKMPDDNKFYINSLAISISIEDFPDIMAIFDINR